VSYSPDLKINIIGQETFFPISFHIAQFLWATVLTEVIYFIAHV